MKTMTLTRIDIFRLSIGDFENNEKLQFQLKVLIKFIAHVWQYFHSKTTIVFLVKEFKHGQCWLILHHRPCNCIFSNGRHNGDTLL